MSTYRGAYVYQDNPALLRVNAGIMAARGTGPVSYANSGPVPTAPHGTAAAARRHYNNDEKPCEPCRAEANRVRRERSRARREAAAQRDEVAA